MEGRLETSATKGEQLASRGQVIVASTSHQLTASKVHLRAGVASFPGLSQFFNVDALKNGKAWYLNSREVEQW